MTPEDMTGKETVLPRTLKPALQLNNYLRFRRIKGSVAGGRIVPHSTLHSPIHPPVISFLRATVMASSISRSVVKKVLSSNKRPQKYVFSPNASRHHVTSTDIHRWRIIGGRRTCSPLDRFPATAKLDALPHARPLPYCQGCST